MKNLFEDFVVEFDDVEEWLMVMKNNEDLK